MCPYPIKEESRVVSNHVVSNVVSNHVSRVGKYQLYSSHKYVEFERNEKAQYNRQSWTNKDEIRANTQQHYSFFALRVDWTRVRNIQLVKIGMVRKSWIYNMITDFQHKDNLCSSR